MRCAILICLGAVLMGCGVPHEEVSTSVVSGTVIEKTSTSEEAFKKAVEDHSFVNVIPARVLGDAAQRATAFEHLRALEAEKDRYFHGATDQQVLSKLWDRVLASARELVEFAEAEKAAYDPANNSLKLKGAKMDRYNTLLDAYYIAVLNLEKRTKQIEDEQRHRAK